MNGIRQNIAKIRQRIETACHKSGRNLADIKLLLATKTVSPDRIQIALETGETLIAENKVQELKEKYSALQSLPHTKHFIGHLQSNKINDLLRCDVACLHSLDRLSLAEKLQKRLTATNRTLDVLIQVNTSKEDSKFGLPPERTLDFVRQVSAYDRLQVKGLMTIGLFSAEADRIRPCFQMLRQLQEQIRAAEIPNVRMDELSMGMSGDMDIAIEEGATILRIGTAIFGARPLPDQYYWNEHPNG